MFIRVSNERVIAGKMRTPGEVIDVSELDGEQAVRDGYAKRVDGRAKTKEPALKAAAPPVHKSVQEARDPMVQPQPTESLEKADPQGSTKKA